MNKGKTNDIKLLGTLVNSDESGIIAYGSQIYDSKAGQSMEDTGADHEARVKQLETWDGQLQESIENITNTGEASAAANVTYNHNDSKLDASNVQQAIDEVYRKSNPNDGAGGVADTNTIMSVDDNPEFVKVETDSEGKVVAAINAKGEFIGGGINLSELSERHDADMAAIRRTVESNTLAIEYDSETGNIYSITGEESVMDVTMDAEGNIYVEQTL